MNEDRTIWWWAIGVVAAGAVAATFWWFQVRAPAPAPAATAPPSSAVSEAAAPGEAPPVRHPIEAAPAAVAADAAASLPPLADSDSVFRPAISALIGEKALVEFFAMTGLAARIVATVDNLPRSKVATSMLPVRGPGGGFIVDGVADGLGIGAANAERYSAHLRLAESVSMDRLAAAYVGLYPLLQQAYRELGYPQGHFNDRLVEVIDHLLATPAVDEPIPLVQPKVLYQFADPDLESRSAGQKLLLRMGAGNAARVKKTLLEFRREITAAPLPQ
jgi:hypothetical protein